MPACVYACLQFQVLRGRDDGTCEHDVLKVSFPQQAAIARFALIHESHTRTNKQLALRALCEEGSDLSMDAEIPQISLDELTFFG